MNDNTPTILLLIARDRKEEEHTSPSEHVLRWSRALNLPQDAFHTIFVPEGGLPKTVKEDLILISGSKHSAYEDLPWIEDFEEQIRQWMNQGTPLFGVCFGHQIIAKALGGAVEKGANGAEVEAVEVELTEAGRNDVAFSGFEKPFQIGTFHKDVVTTLPEKAIVLAKNTKYNTQALRFNERTIGVQFHPEFTAKHIIDIIERNKEDLVKNEVFSSIEEQEDAKKKLESSNIDDVGPKLAQQILKELIKK